VQVKADMVSRLKREAQLELDSNFEYAQEVAQSYPKFEKLCRRLKVKTNGGLWRAFWKRCNQERRLNRLEELKAPAEIIEQARERYNRLRQWFLAVYVTGGECEYELQEKIITADYKAHPEKYDCGDDDAT
jgi:hypothetical protein